MQRYFNLFVVLIPATLSRAQVRYRWSNDPVAIGDKRSKQQAQLALHLIT